MYLTKIGERKPKKKNIRKLLLEFASNIIPRIPREFTKPVVGKWENKKKKKDMDQKTNSYPER